MSSNFVYVHILCVRITDVASGSQEVCPERLSPAQGSSLSVFLEDGDEAHTEDGTPSLPGPKRSILQSKRGRTAGWPLGQCRSVRSAPRAEGAAILEGLKGRPRLSSHKFQSHGAHRRG